MSSDTLVGIINPRRRKRRKATRRKKRAVTRRAPARKRRPRRRKRAAASHLFGAKNAPRRRRRRGTVAKRRRSRRLRGRRNPGALVMNPGGGSLMSTIRDAAPLVLGTTGGMVGTRMLSGLAASYIPGGSNPWVKAGIRAGITLGGYYLLRRMSRKAATGWLVGGGVSTLEATAQAISPDLAASIGLGADPTSLRIGAGVGAIESGMGSIVGMSGLACGELVVGY